MSKNMLILMGMVGGILAMAGLCQAVLVDGYCYLENQTNHEGTKVFFQADSPGATTDSAFTNTSGYYQEDLAAGGYDVFFTHEGYYDDAILDQLFFSPTTLPEVTLFEMIGIPISGSLSGVLEDTIYIVVDDIYVEYGNTLTIEAGAIFHFAGDYTTFYDFDIDGELHAQGTEGDSIKFMLGPVSTAWGGIYFSSSASDSSRLEYCLITGSNSSGVYCTNSNPTISHCTISENSAEYGFGGGILCENDSNPTISHCTITGNFDDYNGGGIRCHWYSSPIISHCTISGNSAGCDGGGIYCWNHSSPTISYCTISGNSAGAYCGGIFFESSSPEISYCTISGNSADYDGGGISCYSSSPEISYCTISGNSAGYDGGGISFYGSSPTIVNTIVEGNAGDGGIYFYNSPNASITYGDFWNNEGGNFIGDPPQWLGEIVTVNANGDSCDLYYNVFLDPLFENPHIGNFQITWANFPIPDSTRSPCIDAGDPNSPLDPDSTIADIGALYFDQGPVLPQPEIEVSASLLDFGSVAIGNQADMPLTIYNVGDTTLVVYDITTSEASFSTNFNQADSLIAPGDSLLITVSFTPAEITTYYEALTIENNDETVVVTLQGEGVGPIEVTLTPYNPPIIIPENGGSFDFIITVENLTAAPQTLDFWTQIELPGIGTVEVLVVTDLTLPGGVSIDRDRTQQVPGFAPAGTYTYCGFVGDYPWVVEDYDTFTFEKEGSERGGSLGSPSDWLCTGEPFEVDLKTEEIPEVYALHAPYPNPFNPTTTITYALPKASRVDLAIYDVSGRQVATLVDGWRQAGTHEVTFDGSGLSSGVYIYRLEAKPSLSGQAGEFSASGKMILMK